MKTANFEMKAHIFLISKTSELERANNEEGKVCCLRKNIFMTSNMFKQKLHWEAVRKSNLKLPLKLFFRNYYNALKRRQLF